MDLKKQPNFFQSKANFIIILYCLMFQAAKLQEISQVSEGDFMDWLIFSLFPYFFLIYLSGIIQ